MEKIGYPGLEAQQRAHAAFIEKLVNIDLNTLDDIDNNQQEYLTELINFLLGWLSNHILGSDKKIGEFVKEKNIVISWFQRQKVFHSHKLARRWGKDLLIRPDMNIKVGCYSHDMRIQGRLVKVCSTEQAVGIITFFLLRQPLLL